MSQDFFYPPGSSNVITASFASEGAVGAPAPSDAILVAGENPSGDLQPLQTDVSGNLLIAGTVATGGLTDAELRATPVPISGTVSTGGLTDAELRASAVPVSAASLPLPAGAATEATLAAISAQLPAVLGQGTAADSLAVVLAVDQTEIPIMNGFSSVVNATTTPLLAAGVFQGVAEDLLPYSAIDISLTADQDGVLLVEYSQDSINFDINDSYTIDVAVPGTPEGFFFQVTPKARLYRLTYTNGATAQGVFRLESLQRVIPVPLNGQMTMQLSQPVVIASDQSPVPISGTVSTGGLTDAELRATPVPISGTVTANAGTGTFAISAAALPLPAGAATEASLVAFSDKTAGAFVPEAFDYSDITYVGATTDIDTVVYKTGGAGGTTVATLTMGYDGSNRLTSVTKT